MALTTARWERVGIVSTNVSKLCALINVADEQYFLQRCMSPGAFEECMTGDTNVTRVQILCEKMVQDIMAGNMKLYDAFSAYFLQRADDYKCMYLRFTAIDSADSANGDSSSNGAQSELLFLQERVKELTEELRHLRQTDCTINCQSELIAVSEILAEKETASLFSGNIPVINSVNDAMEVEKIDPADIVEQPLLKASQQSSCGSDNHPVLKENIPKVEDAAGENKENENSHDDGNKFNVPEAGVTNGNEKHSYKCGYCGKMFRMWAHLVLHVRVHTGQSKPYACNMCEKRFGRKNCLERHSLTHSGEKPFACQYCRERFAEQEHLLQHSRIHTGDRSWVCKRCNATFQVSTELRQHWVKEHSHATLSTQGQVASCSV